MFAIQRFDGSAAQAQSSEAHGGAAPSNLDRRIALLNQRKAEALAAKVSDEAKADESTVNVGGLKIHPSRLAASHILRQSERKARSSLSGTVKEKTKAKQRYLNRKKDRRKKRKVVTALQNASKKKKTGVTGAEVAEHRVEDGNATANSSDDADSTSGGESEVQGQQQEGDSSSPADVEMTEGHGEMSDSSKSEIPVIKDEEEAALMRLPTAQSTSQASKRDLAAQGLPAGLANPTLVNAAQTSTLVSSTAEQPLGLISDSMRRQLDAIGIQSWFAVQTAIIPKLLEHPSAYDLYPDKPPGDICVSAPTGSGKTLSYVVPIVEVLRHRVCRRVRALILLPTRDLVHQVRETLEAVSKASGLTYATLTGQRSFAHEQAQLVDAPTGLLKQYIPGLLASLPGSQEEREMLVNASQQSDSDHLGIESKVDIVIATPGRLIDHMDQTPGFTLQHLRFLVIDEADRLLSQSFQEWLPRILDAIDPRAQKQTRGVVDQTKFESALHPAWLLEQRHRQRDATAAMLQRREHSVQKLLFSATLTRDPAKIVELRLRDASFISVEDSVDGERQAGVDWQDSFALPATLTEHLLVTSTADKPLDLLYLLYLREPEPLRQVLCFTKSVESAARLVKLLEFFDNAWRLTHADHKALAVREHSSELRGSQRSALLNDIKSGSVDVVVCSDIIARGIDLPDVRHVVSYDAPVDMAKYVHRVGRTARANRQGDAWTLVEEQEARHFKQMIKRAGRQQKMNRTRLPKSFKQKTDGQQTSYIEMHSAYKSALSQLEEHFSSSRSRT
jgi:ATP-dependent RNA helicase DDX51/DBP6